MSYFTEIKVLLIFHSLTYLIYVFRRDVRLEGHGLQLKRELLTKLSSLEGDII